MSTFIGSFDCKLDSKKRLAVPSGLLKQLAEDHDGQFVLNRGLEQNLLLYPSDNWKKVSEHLEQLNRYEPKARRFVRNFFHYASQLRLDSSNRLLLPKALLEFAQIQTEVRIACVGREIEIWNPVLNDQALNMSTEEYSDLAQELLGDGSMLSGSWTPRNIN